MKGMAIVLSNPGLYRLSGKIGRWVMSVLPILLNNKRWNPWYKQRNLPAAPKQSFRDWYIQKNKQ
jgi:L-lactate dehydrogenase complex protein LldF